jgi:hypothetical protein
MSVVFNNNQTTLSWTNNPKSNPVMIVRVQAGQSYSRPKQGVSYAVGNTIETGNGIVIYKGGASTYTDTDALTSSTKYIYRFYSVNNDYYSEGEIQEIITPSQASDYFSTNGSGTWSSISWNASSDNINWVPASISPTGSEAGVTIRSGDILLLDSDITLEGSLFLTKTSSAFSEIRRNGYNLTVNGGVYVKMNFSGNDRRYLIGFPFEVNAITDASGNAITKYVVEEVE